MMLSLPQSTQLRKTLHEVIYSDSLKLGYMIELFNSNIFNIECNCQEKTLNIKIKKTNIRKMYGTSYTHNVFFYNEIFKETFKTVIERFVVEITESLRQTDFFPDLIEENRVQEFYNYLLLLHINPGNICTINVLLDNTILIIL